MARRRAANSRALECGRSRAGEIPIELLIQGVVETAGTASTSLSRLNDSISGDPRRYTFCRWGYYSCIHIAETELLRSDMWTRGF